MSIKIYVQVTGGHYTGMLYYVYYFVSFYFVILEPTSETSFIRNIVQTAGIVQQNIK
jgi:hypothetical protein